MNRRFLIGIATLFLNPIFINSQGLPDYNDLFLQSEIATVHINIHPDSLAAILHPDSLGNDHEFPAQFIYSAEGIQDTIETIGFRLRGNTSRQAAKKSFKVSFNTFEAGFKYKGLEKMNLNGSANDPSNIRVKLYWDALRHAGLRGSRTSHVNLYINQEFRGVYTHVEHIDEEFVDVHFDHGDGNLWKCLYPANLQFLGSDPDAYKLEFFGRRVYELKTNEVQDDYTRLAQFIGTLNNAPISNLNCSLGEYFDIEGYIPYLAMDILLGNWDGYPFNMNNFYLYEDPLDNKIHYLPYDLDNVMGIDYFGLDWTERDPYDWSPGEGSRPLYDRVMQVPEWREKFNFYMHHFIGLFYSENWLEMHANALQEMLEPFMMADPYYPLDYGFTFDDFQASVDESWGEHVPYGIMPYFNARVGSLNNFLELNNVSGLVDHVSDNAPLI